MGTMKTRFQSLVVPMNQQLLKIMIIVDTAYIP